MRRKIGTILFLIGAYLPSNAQVDAGKGASVSSIVVELRTGKVIEEYCADVLLTPASLTKLLTTAATLEMCGPQKKIETVAYLSVDNNQLIIKGKCDPTMGSKYYQWHSVEAFASDIASNLKKQKHTQIDCIVFDSGYISGSTYFSKRLWEDMGNYYGVAPNAFCIADNMSTYSFASPAEVGEKCTLTSILPNEGQKVDCLVKTYGKQSDSVYIYGMGQQWYATGCMPCAKVNYMVKGTMVNPQKVFEQKFVSELNRLGIKIVDSKSVTAFNYSNCNKIATSYSPTIESIIKVTNHESVNLYADALMLHLAGEKQTSVDAGMQQLRTFVGRINKSECMLYDGSGLSPMNALSARQMANVILYMAKSEYAREYEASLAVAGVSGTMKRLGKNTQIENRVKGKSGSMTGVLSYAGIITAKSGKQYVFCIIINHSQLNSSELRQRVANWLTTFVGR